MKDQEEKNEFERLLKEKAEGFEIQPSGVLWPAIESEIAVSGNRSWTSWLVAAGLISLTATASYFMFQNKDAGKEPHSAHEQQTRPEALSLENPLPANESTVVPDEDPASMAKSFTSRNNGKGAKNDKRHGPQRTEVITEQTHTAYGPVSFSAEESMTYAALQTEWLSGPEEKAAEESILPIQRFVWTDAGTGSGSGFLLEADGMAIGSWVQNSGGTPSDALILLANEEIPFKFSGYSTGLAAYFSTANKWFLGTGLHITQTDQPFCIYETSGMVYDTAYVYDNSTGSFLAQVDSMQVYDKHTYESDNLWLDASIYAGVNLFGSRHHLRLMTGGGYSRLLRSEVNGDLSLENVFSTSGSSSPVSTTASSSGSPVIFIRNQLHLMGEAVYAYDLTPLLSVTAGARLMYYPLEQLNSEVYSQKMSWLGLKAGLVFRL